MALSCHDRPLMSTLAFGRGRAYTGEVVLRHRFCRVQRLALLFGFAATVVAEEDVFPAVSARVSQTEIVPFLPLELRSGG